MLCFPLFCQPPPGRLKTEFRGESSSSSKLADSSKKRQAGKYHDYVLLYTYPSWLHVDWYIAYKLCSMAPEDLH